MNTFRKNSIVVTEVIESLKGVDLQVKLFSNKLDAYVVTDGKMNYTIKASDLSEKEVIEEVREVQSIQVRTTIAIWRDGLNCKVELVKTLDSKFYVFRYVADTFNRSQPLLTEVEAWNLYKNTVELYGGTL